MIRRSVRRPATNSREVGEHACVPLDSSTKAAPASAESATAVSPGLAPLPLVAPASASNAAGAMASRAPPARCSYVRGHRTGTDTRLLDLIGRAVVGYRLLIHFAPCAPGAGRAAGAQTAEWLTRRGDERAWRGVLRRCWIAASVGVLWGRTASSAAETQRQRHTAAYLC